MPFCCKSDHCLDCCSWICRPCNYSITVIFWNLPIQQEWRLHCLDEQFDFLFHKSVLNLGHLFKWNMYCYLIVGLWVFVYALSKLALLIKASCLDIEVASVQSVKIRLRFAGYLEPKFPVKTHRCLCQQKRKITHLFLS